MSFPARNSRKLFSSHSHKSKPSDFHNKASLLEVLEICPTLGMISRAVFLDGERTGSAVFDLRVCLFLPVTLSTGLDPVWNAQTPYPDISYHPCLENPAPGAVTGLCFPLSLMGKVPGLQEGKTSEGRGAL